MRVELICAVLLCAAPAAARVATVLPDADAVLVASLSAPATGYTALGRTQSFAPGRGPKALGMTIYSLPGGRLRREVRKSPGRPAEQIFVDDGAEQKLYWPRLKTVWSGAVTRETAAEQAARLRSLYEVSITTGGQVAKRPTWRLNLASPHGLGPALVRRSLWVDRATGLLLKCEEYGLDGALARRERLTKLTAASPDPALFRLSVPPGTAVAPLTAPRGDERLAAAAADFPARFPRWIPDGYLALNLTAGGKGKAPSLFVGYGDGATAFTILEAPSGADLGADEKTGRAVRLNDGTLAYFLAGPDGLTLVRRTKDRAYAITGGLTEDEMVRVVESIAEPAS